MTSDCRGWAALIASTARLARGIRRFAGSGRAGLAGEVGTSRLPLRARGCLACIDARTLVRSVLSSGLSLGLIVGLSACAVAPPAADTASLLDDRLFTRVEPMPDSAAVFALSAPMKAFAETHLSRSVVAGDPRPALVQALYTAGQLRMQYDATRTHTAAEAYAARAGNCLSLVVMTAAFAKHLGLPVSYREIGVSEQFSRAGDLTLASGHVNLALERVSTLTLSPHYPGALIVDFLPGNEMRGQRARPISEARLLSMFMNNRAAEALAAGRLDAAYWHVRAALHHDPAHTAAVNTLGIVYQRAGHAGHAERALRAALALDPQHVAGLSNLAQLLERQGHAAEAAALAQRLLALQPHPPFHFYDLGRSAAAAGRWHEAAEHFAQELRRQPEQPEVHFWAALAQDQLGQRGRVVRHLRRAVAHSRSPAERQRYADELARWQQTGQRIDPQGAAPPTAPAAPWPPALPVGMR
jgi:tetratricopeptide (TPR) repeat protein